MPSLLHEGEYILLDSIYCSLIQLILVGGLGPSCVLSMCLFCSRIVQFIKEN